MKKVQFAPIVSNFSISNYIYSTDCSFLHWYISSIIHCASSSPPSSNAQYISNMHVCLAQINTRIWYSHIYALFNLHVQSFLLAHTHIRTPTIAHKRTRNYEKEISNLIHLQLLFGHIDLLIFFRSLYRYTLNLLPPPLRPFSSMFNVFGALLSNNSWPIRFRLPYFVLGSRWLRNKYIHTVRVLLEKTIVNYFCRCHRYYYRQTFVIQWKKRTRRTQSVCLLVFLNNFVYTLPLWIAMFCTLYYMRH